MEKILYNNIPVNIECPIPPGRFIFKNLPTDENKLPFTSPSGEKYKFYVQYLKNNQSIAKCAVHVRLTRNLPNPMG